MKLAGETQAMLVKYALAGVLVIGAAWWVKRQVEGAAGAAGRYVSDAVDAVLELPGKAYDAVADAVRVDNPPLADLGTYSPRVEERWQQVQKGEAKPSFWYDLTHLFNFGD